MASTQDALQPVVSARTLTVKLLRALESVGVARKSLTMERSRESGRAAPISGKGLNSAIHEINNPLESLLNLLYLVENDSALSPESRNHLRMAQAEVMRVSRIAQATMKRSRHAEPAKEADVAALLASVVELHKNKLDRHKVSVSARGDHETTIIVHPEQMRQVFSNLLLNAVDAMPEGGTLSAKISKTHEWCGKERDGVRITIADTGTGIPCEILSHIREPFFTTKGASGNGMGLAVVHEIVTEHQGHMKIRSSIKEGKSGSVFNIFIPAIARE
jgi:signal transduction histidine kinase